MAQVAFTVAVLAWLFQKTDWPNLLQRFQEMDPWWFAAAAASYGCNISISSGRWWIILRALSRPAPLPWLWRLNWVGAYFNQVLPGSVSGDFLRAWYTRHQAHGMPFALAAVFSDRFIGMGALVGIALTAFLLGGRDVALLPGMDKTMAVVVLGYLVIVVLILTPWLNFLATRLGKIGNALHDIRLGMAALLRHPQALAATIGLSLIVQGFSILTFWCLAKSLGLALDPAAVWLVWPLVSLFLALPISFAGWGLREGLVVLYLGALHIGHDAALALSLLTGATVLLMSLPGVLLWFGIGRHPLSQLQAIEAGENPG
ncbi:lysylphosphatidylglycerol synthase transmembrane domain-containing protein [Acidithiobacillus sp.]|uniref:lysylphosphatidylglycerol synthase transmembrane domain-containing protein n=1 Tax=Acidithiobacillus sp. TaxID=1872118 RepID=UPI0025C39992|nr:lysylphosphatidylglycerol synthase transmembrane domain-containing protein [Acidithiobacillus sp.]